MNKTAQEEARTRRKRVLNFPITLQFKVIFERREDLEKVRDLMRRQSSAIRAIYQRLKKGQSQKEIYNYVKETYKLSPWYISSAIQVARALPKDKKVIFGGKSLFEKLKKKHLQGKRKKQLKREWKEKRQGRLLSMGSEKHKGNHCIRFEEKEGVLYLNILVEKELKKLEGKKREQSHQSEPVSCLETPTEGRVGQERRETSLKHWRVLKVVLLVPVLGKALPRDFSSLKGLLISGIWNRERVGPVPFGFGGTKPKNG
ncbi:hypothetical protein [Thermocrinis sp.]